MRKKSEEQKSQQEGSKLENLTYNLPCSGEKMSKSSSRVDRHESVGWKSPNLRKEVHGNHSCMLRIGERLMRAGSEGNLIYKPIKTSQIFSDGPREGLNEHTQLGLKDKPKCTGNNCSKGTFIFFTFHNLNTKSYSNCEQRTLYLKEAQGGNLSVFNWFTGLECRVP